MSEPERKKGKEQARKPAARPVPTDPDEDDGSEAGNLDATFTNLKARRVPASEPDEEDEVDELDATFAKVKARPVPKSKADTDLMDLGATSITDLKIQQIPGLKLVRELGRGAMGVVYHGKQEFLDREVAVKMLLEQRKDAEYSARFKREAKILAGLQHPHIVACYQADVTKEGVCFLVMEFVKGPNLREFLKKNGPIAVVDALRVCRDLASALECAYQQTIIHRDVKSENVLLAPEPRAPAAGKFRFRVKLSDLGLARPESSDTSAGEGLNLTVARTIMGTPLTMSPEQFDDPQGVDLRTDIYGLGCVMYDMLTAKPAFTERTLTSLVIAKRNAKRGPDPRGQRPDVDPEVGTLVMSMLAAAREDRPQDHETVIKACDSLLERLAGKPGVAEKRGRPVGLYAAAGAACILGGVGLWWQLRDKKPSKEPSKVVQTPVPTPAPVQPALMIEPVKGAKEGQTVELVATPSGFEGSSAPVLTWDQVGGPKVELHSEGSRATFVAPRKIDSYELKFRVSARPGAEPVSSEILTCAVEAHDDAPVLTIHSPDKVKEYDSVTLTADLDDPDGHGTQSFTWNQIGEPKVQFDPHGKSVTFSAPGGYQPYDILIALDAKAGDKEVPREARTVHVEASNAAPLVTLSVPEVVEGGERVEVKADVKDSDSLDLLKYDWSCKDPESISIEGRNSKQASFIAPYRAGGDYDLKLSLQVTDVDQAPASSHATIQVHCDPELAPLSKTLTAPWMFHPDTQGLGKWKASEPAPKVLDNPDGFTITSAKTEGWISRSLPRGTFSFTTTFMPQAETTTLCGLRFVYGEKSAQCFCMVPDGTTDGLRFVDYVATKDEAGAWSLPPTQERRLLGPWARMKSIELEVNWDESKLALRWRSPENGSWISASVAFPLASRPRAVTLTVANGRMLVKDIGITGL